MFGGGIAASGQLHPALGLRALSWRSNRGQNSTGHEFCKMVFVFCFFDADAHIFGAVSVQ
jgi:hypothetical protein